MAGLLLWNMGSYPTSMKYYRDHLPFREQLIGLYARVNRALFDRDSSVTTVAFGKDGWFFHNNVNDGDPIATYRGEDTLTTDELRQIVSNLRRTRDNLKAQGIEFALFIAPNKERVYSEYMPDRYGAPAENTPPSSWWISCARIPTSRWSAPTTR